MVNIGNLFNDFMNLIGLRYYNKEESDNNYATKTHTHTDYLTSHQDISGKEDKTNKKNEIPTDATLSSENVYYPTMNAVRNYAQPKGSYVTTSDSRLSDARTPTSHSHGNITNDGKVGTDSGKIITTGTGGLLQASGSISKSMINDFPSEMTPTSHEHSTSDVKDNSAYTHIGSSANSTQKTINDKINTALGLKADSNNVYSKSETYTQSEITTAISNAVSNLQLFEVVNTLPTNNIKTNRLYLIVNDTAITNNSYDIYLRVNNSWEQLDSLNVDVSNFYNKTEIDTLLNGKVDTSDSRLSDTRTPKSHSHGNISNTGTMSGKGANVVTDGNGNITTEAKPHIPQYIDELPTATLGMQSIYDDSESIYLFDRIKYDLNEIYYTNDNGDEIQFGDFENINKKSSNITTDTGSTTKYPTVKAVEDYVNSKVDASFKVEVIDNGWTVEDLESSYGNVDGEMFGYFIEDESISYDANTIYLLPSQSDDPSYYNEYILIDDANTTPIFELLGTTQIDLTWSSITGKPSTFTPSSHNHGSLNSAGTLNSDISSVNKIAVTDSSNNLKTISQLPYSKISGTPTVPSKTSDLTNDSGFLTSHQDISGKAPNNHASSATTYGVGTSSNYGHVKVADNLTTSSFSSSAPVVLSAYQGKLLKDNLNNIIFYEISSSNYSPTIDSSVTISVKAVNLSGSPVANHSFVLNANGTNVSLTTSNSNGIATYTYTCSSWGLHTFSVRDNSIQINVKGRKTVQTLSPSGGTVTVYCDGKLVTVNINGSFTPSTSASKTITTISSTYAPLTTHISPGNCITNPAMWSVKASGEVIIEKRSNTNSVGYWASISYPLKDPYY